MKNNELQDVEFDGDIESLEDKDEGIEDIIEAVESSSIAPDMPIYHLRLACSGEKFYAVYKDGQIAPKSQVLVPTRYGRDLAIVMRQIKKDSRKFPKIAWIERPACEEDLERARNNIKYEEKALITCREMINNHGLDKAPLEMNLLVAHYLLEEPKIVFFYTAQRRVDFRALLKDLIAYFKMRIQMQQIHFRSAPRIYGGIGICGKEYCCCTILDRIKQPIAIHMAKDQNLSINVNKISGPCEKLLCCLSYECEYYREQLKFMPPKGHKLTYQGNLWKVVDINIILGMVTMETEDGKRMSLPKTQFEKNDNRWYIKNQGQNKKWDK
ncbi:MAG: hypothetical protein LBG74_05895 [Spirochaetaceae bacterium]|jgi:cell fate regulator YaaT (PSP1 superfamily)|nr:hypothetical protein [Spirochaetaceae bacterium]